MPSTDKYCEDCRFYVAPPSAGQYGDARCRRPREPQLVELISREAKRPDAFCDLERGGSPATSCGRDAKHFQAKQTAEVA